MNSAITSFGLGPSISTQISDHKRCDVTFEAATLAEMRKAFGEEGLREVLSLFRTELSTTIAQIHAAIEAGDAVQVRFLAHRLKGACYQLGAKRCGEVAAALELQSSQSKFSGHVVASLEHEGVKLERVLERLT